MPKAGKQPKPRQFALPFTPVRRLFQRRKSEPLHDYGEPDPVVATPHVHCHPPGGVALQNEDTAEDAIVITALDTIPFCCHEDLLSMTHAQLITVAAVLNAKLPAVLAIDLAGDPTFIRNSVEVIVGLRRSFPPPASHRLSVTYDSVPDSPPTGSPPTGSPCSTRLSIRGTPKLTRLEETDEEDDLPRRKPHLRRASINFSPTPHQRPRTVTQPRHKSDNYSRRQAEAVEQPIPPAPLAMENMRKDVYGVLPSLSSGDIFTR